MSSPSPTKTPSKGEETRQHIVGHALSMATRVGLLGLSLGPLADSLGMSKSGLFAHFRSKDNLQVAVLEEGMRRYQSAVVFPALRQPRGEPRVRALFEGWIAWSRADFMPGGCIFFAAAAELDDQPGPARDVLFEMQTELSSTLARAARVAKEEGHFRAELDEVQFAFEWFSMMMGFHLHDRMLSMRDAESRLRTAFERLLEDARAPQKHRRRR